MMVDDSEFKDYVKHNETVVALILPEDADHFWKYCEIFSHSVEVDANATFVVLTDRNAPKSYKNFTTFDPAIAFFFNSTAYFATAAPLEVEVLHHVLRVSILKQSRSASNLDDFYKFYDQFKLTIISTQDKFEHSRELYIKHSFSKGPLGLCIVEPSFFEELGHNPTNFMLYRKSEDVFAEFDGTDDSLNEASLNLVNYEIDRNTMILKNRLIVTAIHEGDVHPDINFLPVAKKYSKPLYGYLDPDAYGFIINLLEHVKTPKPYITIFNYTGFFVYEPLTDFSQDKLEKYVADVLDGKVSKVFASEKIPSEQNPNNATKLVGVTYEEYLKDDSKDTLIFYTSIYTEAESELIHNFANYTKENNIDVRVAYINYDNNSCATEFPVFAGFPHCEFFPAKNYDKHEVCFTSISIYSLLHFLELHASTKIVAPIELYNETFEKEFIMAQVFRTSIDSLPECEKYLRPYTVEYGKRMNAGDDYDQITRTFFKGIRGIIDNEDEFEDGDVPESLKSASSSKHSKSTKTNKSSDDSDDEGYYYYTYEYQYDDEEEKQKVNLANEL